MAFPQSAEAPMNSSRPFGVRSVREEYPTAEEDAGRFGRPARAGGRASSSLVHRGRLDPPFFQAKLRAPSRPRHFVRRRRLLSLLDDLSEYPITAIVAPAGAGKTVLAADWLADRAGPGAWLTLDA